MAVRPHEKATELPDSPLSLWLDRYGDYRPEPALAGEAKADVAIVGGGFTGLMTAIELKRAEPSLEVAVLEAKTVGYGASGRNGSFGMTVVGLGFTVNAIMRGRQFVREAHQYMERAVDRMWELIAEEELDCDGIRPGFLRVATTAGYVRRIQKDIELVHSLGIEGIEWIDRDAVRERVCSERYLGAMWEPRLVLVDPAKLVREERRLALAQGVKIYENTPVTQVQGKPRFRLDTPDGALTADKLVLATNAYSHLFAQTRRKQAPAFTYMIATEPLTDAQLEPMGWQGREGVEDARNLIHYYRLTPDRRLVMGGGPVGLTWANTLDADRSGRAWKHLRDHVAFLFPSLADASITHRWGGPFSVTMDLAPAMGYLGDRRAVYSLGCIGHGVSMSHLNAQTLRDLLLKRQSELTDCPFVNRRVVPWPPEPVRMAAALSIRAYLQAEDWYHERSLPKP